MPAARPHGSISSLLLSRVRLLNQHARTRVALGAATCAYLAVLLAAPTSGPGIIAAIGAVATLPLLMLRPLSAKPAVLAASWPTLHALLIATGGLASPLLPLSAGWCALVSRRSAPGAAAAAAAAVATLPLLLLGEWLYRGQISISGAVLLILLVGLGSSAPLLLARTAQAQEPGQPGTPADPPHEPASETKIVTRVLDLARRAAGADEVVLWERADGAEVLRKSARSGSAGSASADTDVPLEGHPFGWAVREQVNVHLERGKRPLPIPWATEMLLVPCDGDAGLLTFAFAGVVPAGSGEAATMAGQAVADTRRLFRENFDLGKDRARLHVFAAAVQTLPMQLNSSRFATVLAEALLELTGGQGVTVALWDTDSNSGTIIGGAGTSSGIPAGHGFSEGESRLALACKHSTPLCFPDFWAETRDVPLLSSAEGWTVPPASVLVQPIYFEERTLGAVAIWHTTKAALGPAELESVQMLCLLAAPALRISVMYEQLDRKAATDPLTGLPNRGSFNARLAASCSHFQRYGRPFSLIVIDVDHFKRFNDTWGHEAGDRVLQHVASIIRSSVREVDLPARLGGEEFVVLLPETPLDLAVAVAERIRVAVEGARVTWDHNTLSTTVSLGVAACPFSTPLAAELLAAADAALYRAKELGRNRIATSAPELPRPSADRIAPG